MPFIPPLITCTPDAQPLYAPITGGGGGGSTALQFTATGSGGAGGFISTGPGANVVLDNGSFVSGVTTTAIPSGAEVLVLQNDTASTRWGIGYAPGSETGVGNAGADFAINAYSDAGALLSTPLSIDRSSGIVTANGLVPVPGVTTTASALLTGAIAVGLTSGIAMGTYTAPRSGMYLFTGAFICNVATGIAGFCSMGERDNVGITISNIPTGFSVTVGLKPWTMPNTDAIPAGFDYTIYNTVPIQLQAGIVYQITGLTVNASTPSIMVFPTGVTPGEGGATFTSAIVPLC